MEGKNGILAWANTHNCKFGIKKFQLLDFTKETVPHPFIRNKRVPSPWTALKIGDHHIPSKDTAKFLGVILDNKLNWKSHGATALAKCQDWLFKLGRISKTYKVTHAKQIRQIYLAVEVPRMLYVADVFLTLHTRVGRRGGNSKYTSNNQKISIYIKRSSNTNKRSPQIHCYWHSGDSSRPPSVLVTNQQSQVQCGNTASHSTISTSLTQTNC